MIKMIVTKWSKFLVYSYIFDDLGLKSSLEDDGVEISIRKICKILNVPRSSFYYKPQIKGESKRDTYIEAKIKEIIDDEPAYGLRFITAILRNKMHIKVNRKKVHRIIKLNNW